MALVTFVPGVKPSPGGSVAPKVNLYKAEFGDGYTMSGPRGLNHIAQQVNLRWDGLTLSETQALNTFFTTQAGYIAFIYQVWGTAAALKWTCSDWSWSNAAPFTFQAKLVQSFTLEV